MTYPQQYQQPPQGYAPAPQQPQYGAPQGYPQQYQQPPAQPAPAPQFGGQAMPTTPPPLGQSGRAGGGATAPQPRHLIGRTVIFEPIRIDDTTTAKDNAGNTVSRPTAYYHLTVVDGGPLQYGDNRDHDVSKQHGMTFEIQTPCRFTNVSSDRFGIVNEIRDAIARGDMASVGVIVQGTQGNRPFLVTKPSRDLDGKDRPDGDARFARATEVWNQVFAKTFVSPEPRSLVAPPAQAPQQVSYAPAPQAQPGYVQQPAQGYPYGGAAQPLVQPHPYQQQPAYALAQQQGYDPAAYAAPAPRQPDHMAPSAAPLSPHGVPQQYAPPQDPAYLAWLAAQQQGQGQPPQQGPGL